MEKNVKKAIIFGLTLLIGGVFAFIYFNDGSEFPISFPYWGIFAIVVGISFVFSIVKIFKRKQEPPSASNNEISEDEIVLPTMNATKHKTCYWCGSPLEKHNEYCAECGNKVHSCSVCKLPISHGEDVGKCKYCETQGHLIHLLEWVKTQGKCPYCLQAINQNDIIHINLKSKKW